MSSRSKPSPEASPWHYNFKRHKGFTIVSISSMPISAEGNQSSVRRWGQPLRAQLLLLYIVMCQAHPVLVKIRRIRYMGGRQPSLGPGKQWATLCDSCFFKFLSTRLPNLLIFKGLKDPWPRVLSLPGRFRAQRGVLCDRNMVVRWNVNKNPERLYTTPTLGPYRVTSCI